MNKKLLLLISLFFLSLILGVLAVSNLYQINKTLVDVEMSFVNDVTKRDLLATQSVRDSLLLGDFIKAYTSLKNLENDHFFEGFEIWQGDKVVEASKTDDKSSYVIVKHVIHYDFSSKESQWGKIVFWHSKNPILQMKNMAISRFQKTMLVVVSVYSFLVVVAISFLLLNTSYIKEVLNSYFEKNEVKKAPFWRGLLWEPLLLTLGESAIRYEKLRTENEKRLRHEALSKQAKQVAHDIRSPLAALTSILENRSSSIDFDILSKAAERIKKITDVLLNGPLEKERELVCLSELCKRVLREKKVEYQNRKDITFSFKEQSTSKVEVVVGDFERVISNLLNNAVEAIDKIGLIEISVLEEDGLCKIKIRDSGKGMSPEVLSRLGRDGFSDKASGNGLGVAHSFEVVKSNNASILFKSELGKGTIVEISFQLYNREIPKFIVLLENDPLVQLIWRTGAKAKGIGFCVFSEPKELLNSLSQFESETFFYFDLNLNNGVSGVDIAKQVYNHGYNNIYLATGDESYNFESLDFIKGKIGKKFPW